MDSTLDLSRQTEAGSTGAPRAAHAWLPRLESNQESPDPESGVLPITPRGRKEAMKLSGPFFRVNRSLSRAFLGAGLGVFALLGCSDNGGPTAIEIPIVLIEVTQPCSSVIEGQSCTIGVRAFAEG